MDLTRFFKERSKAEYSTAYNAFRMFLWKLQPHDLHFTNHYHVKYHFG